MNPIRSIKSTENSQGIKDEHGDKEYKSKTIGKQVFEKYDYSATTFFNPNDGTLYGVDDVILKDEIPENDPLGLSNLIKGRFSDTNYSIDYKSNNFKSNVYDRGLKSIYIKLMNYRSINPYLPYFTKSNGEVIETVTRYQIMDKNKEKRLKGFKFKRMVEHYYGNHFLLGEDNKTDYYFYIKHRDITPDEEFFDKVYELVSAYLVPAEQLRNQVITILNAILKKGGYNYPIKLREDGLYLNHKIRNALKICEESPGLIKPEILKPQMDLFIRHKKAYSPDKDEIILRIPEKYLTPHIKFNSEGDIIK